MDTKGYEVFIPIPSKKQFMMTYYYKDGKLVYTQKGDGKVPIKQLWSVFEKSFNEDAYKNAVNEVHERMRQEKERFRQDLFELHMVENNPKRFMCFDLAWQYGLPNGLDDVASYFDDLVGLIE